MTGSAGCIAAYLLDEKIADYYVGGTGKGSRATDAHFATVWGRGGEALGHDLGLGLTYSQFAGLLEGRWNGEQLTQPGHRKVRDDHGNVVIDPTTGKAVTEEARTKAIDVTFAAPKSVSELLVSLRHDPERQRQVIDAYVASVHVAFQVAIEDSAKLVRVPVKTPTEVGQRLVKVGPAERLGQASRTQGSATERRTASLVAVATPQFTARPTAASEARGVADPHLHVHVTILGPASVTDPVTGVTSYYTVDEYGLKNRANVEYRNAVAEGEFLRRLEDLDIAVKTSDWDRARHGRITWEIAGSDPAVRKHWSTNGEIAKRLERDHEVVAGKPLTFAQKNAFMRTQRRHKDQATKEQDSNPVFERWADDLAAAGLALDQELGKGRSGRGRTVEERTVELWERLYSPNGLTIADAVFAGDTITPAVARCAVGLGLTLDQQQAVEIELRQDLVVTRDATTEEARYYTTPAVLAMEDRIAATLAAKAAKVLPAPSPEVVAAAIGSQGVRLDDEQRTAVQRACSGRGLLHVEGLAGSGKTTMARAIRDAFQAPGDAQADRIVVVSTAATTAKRTAAALELKDYGSVESVAYRVERRMLRLSAKSVVLVDEAAMVDTARMNTLLKAAGPARLILVGDDAQQSAIGAAGWYASSVAAHGSVTLTRVWRHRDPLDADAYRLLRDGQSGRAIQSLASRGRVHVAETPDQTMAKAMDTYRAKRDAGWAAGDVRIVIDSSNAQVDVANRFVQYQRLQRGEIIGAGVEVTSGDQGRTWRIYEGDQVVFLARHDERRGAITNGTNATVIKLDTTTRVATLALDEGRTTTVVLDEHRGTQPVGLAYAQHVAKYQGGECAIVLGLPGHKAVSNANSGYSMVTRSTHETHLFIDAETHGPDPMGGLAQAWRQAHSKVAGRTMVNAKVEGRGQGAQRNDVDLSAGDDQHRLEVTSPLINSGRRRGFFTTRVGIGVRDQVNRLRQSRLERAAGRQPASPEQAPRTAADQSGDRSQRTAVTARSRGSALDRWRNRRLDEGRDHHQVTADRSEVAARDASLNGGDLVQAPSRSSVGDYWSRSSNAAAEQVASVQRQSREQVGRHSTDDRELELHL